MSTDADKKDTEDRFGAAQVVEFALERYDLARSSDGDLIVIPRNPRAPRIAKEVRSIRADLSRAIWHERRIAVGRETISTALETLAGLAEEATLERVYLRAARKGPSLQVDLGDRFGRYVEVSRYGWDVIDPLEIDDADDVAARVTFKRSAATAELPMPLPTAESGVTRDDLRRLLGLAEDDPRWREIWGWLVASYFEDVPRPILWALGPQGSGKSTRARMILSVVDPADALGREPGKNERDDTTAAAGRYLPTWDNIGTVSPATSDWLCRLVTGVEIGRRALYTDGDLKVSTIRRSGVATSIVLPFGLGADALERLVLLELDRVDEADRRPEAVLWEEFGRLHAGILGALFDDVAGVLAHLSEVRKEARDLPRMADYAVILRALDRHLGTESPDGYAETYARAVSGVMADRASSDPLTAALLKVARSSGGVWSGSAEILLRRIESDRPDDIRAAWPSNPWSLSSALTRNQETLRAAGLTVTRKRVKGAKVIVLDLAESDETP
ncbi:hypothetical protein [Diaminobutyricimonas sp. TR449]|uniref:hypothetical protein n=1 Tax=Diaminobutyricimonas sp. TR449 TaxID=2708076 RepID=UPI0014238A3B|nr:hypothetical protein [Diaminobutyricimonas sp. TR449]